MGQRLYLVDVKSAEAARDRQMREAEKKLRRQLAKSQVKPSQKPPKKVKEACKEKPKASVPVPRAYHRTIVPYRIGLGAQFFDTIEWQTLRYKAIKLYGTVCQCCGASRANGAEIHVDHVKPRSKYPHLELNLDNLQILCRECNLGKGNTDSIDWRTSGTIAQSA